MTFAYFGPNEPYTFVGPYMVPFRRKTFLADIQRVVAAYYRIPEREMRSARRHRYVARPRQVAMYLSRNLTQRSYPEIGRQFGGRDHTTVIHAMRQIDRLRSTDAEIDRDIEILTRTLAA